MNKEYPRSVCAAHDELSELLQTTLQTENDNRVATGRLEERMASLVEVIDTKLAAIQKDTGMHHEETDRQLAAFADTLTKLTSVLERLEISQQEQNHRQQKSEDRISVLTSNVDQCTKAVHTVQEHLDSKFTVKKLTSVITACGGLAGAASFIAVLTGRR